MEVVLQDRPDFAAIDLFLYVVADGKRIPFIVDGGRIVLDPASGVIEGGAIAPTLRLGHDQLAAIRRALIGEALATDDALADARRLRDRLLAMIETEWASRQIDRA